MKFFIKIYLFIFIGVVASIIYIYILLSQTESKLNQNMEALFLEQVKEISLNISHHLHEHIKHDIYTELKENPQLRTHIEHSLSTVITSNYKYVYVLYRDHQGNFRYLLDGSQEDKGEFDEKFSVLSPKWDEAYTKQKSFIIYQTDVDILWITYLQPFVVNKKTEAIIAIDFSVQVPYAIKEATKPMQEILQYIFIALGFLLLILFYQIFVNYKTKKESLIDPLTEVYNRHFLRDFLNSIRTDRYQLIMLDIDYFKKVNDMYGHDAGDYILKTVAKIIQDEIRSHDILVRFGGEEFLIFIQKDKKNEKLVLQIAQRIRKRLEAEEFLYKEHYIKLTISAGVTLHLEQFRTIHDAIKYADNMLYTAKREGRNKVVYLASQKADEGTKIQDINEIKEAIENKKIFCEFQAIYDVAKREIIKYEALVRLKDRNDNIVYPNQFLELIQQTAVYRDMTKNILDIVFHCIEKKEVALSVNLNFSDILDNNMYESIIQMIEQNKKISSFLTIELLEYEPLNENELVKKRLQKIQAYGVKIAIDDFGSGYANYDIFNFIPVDIIKIDASLVKKVNTSVVSHSIVKSIIELAKELDIDVIAEFVESKEILETLKSLDIKYAQGFYLAKPTKEI